MIVQKYEDLIVWQKSMDLVVLVYHFTDRFPREELYGLVIQMRRCAVSIPSNIAEGWARKHRKEFANFLSMAAGSAAELDTQLLLSERLGYGVGKQRKECLDLLEEIQKMLAKMNSSLTSNL